MRHIIQMCVVIIISFIKSYAGNNVSVRQITMEKGFVWSLVRTLLKDEDSRGCAVVLATEKDEVGSSMQTLLREIYNRYSPFKSTRMATFNFSYRDYPGLRKQQDLS